MYLCCCCAVTSCQPDRCRVLLTDMGDVGEEEWELVDPSPGGSKGAGKRRQVEGSEMVPSAKQRRKMLCFVCPDARMHSSCFCVPHHRAVQAMKHQAMRAEDPQYTWHANLCVRAFVFADIRSLWPVKKLLSGNGFL